MRSATASDRDGERLYPAMPYASYAYMTDADVLAIKAYLLTLPPVASTPPAEHAEVPVQPALADGDLVRPVQAGRSFQAGRRQERRMESRRLSRRGDGALRRLPYAAQSACRRSTTRRSSPAAKRKAGSRTTSRATRIPASAPGATRSSRNTSRRATRKAAARASGPMGEAVALSFSKMTPGDIRAMVAYLRTVPAIGDAGSCRRRRSGRAGRSEARRRRRERRRSAAARLRRRLRELPRLDRHEPAVVARDVDRHARDQRSECEECRADRAVGIEASARPARASRCRALARTTTTKRSPPSRTT